MGQEAVKVGRQRQKESPRRPQGRPRVNEPGASPIYTTLSKEQRARLEDLAAGERRSLSSMAAILIAEALARREATA